MNTAQILERTSSTTGKTTFQVRIRRTGVPTLTRSFKSKKEAAAWRDEVANKLNKGELVQTAAMRRITVPEAIQHYLEHAGTRIKSDKERGMLARLKNDFAQVALANLKPSMIQAWVNTLLMTEIPSQANKKKTHRLYKGDTIRTYSESSVRKYFFALKKSLEWYAAFKGAPWETSPFIGIEKPTEDNDRTRRLEGDEEARLLASCDKKYVKKDELKRVIQFAMETAMRAQEILKMRWTDIDPNNRRIIIPRHHSKTKREREVPITTVAAKILKEHEATKKSDEPKVFWQWSNSDTLGHAFRLVCHNAQVHDFKFHDLRHEATSRIYERTTLTDVQIAKITGHSEMSTLKRYANLRSQNLAERLW